MTQSAVQTVEKGKSNMRHRPAPPGKPPLLLLLRLTLVLAFCLPACQSLADLQFSWGSAMGLATLKTKGNSLPTGDPHVAILKAGTVSTGVGITNDSSSYVNQTFYVDAEYTDSVGTTTLSSSSFTKSIPPHVSVTQSLSFTGMPDRVGMGDLTVTITSTGGPWTHDYRVYQLFGTPQAPMLTPWIEVLEDAMRYAQGSATSAVALEKLTVGLYQGGAFTYSDMGITVWCVNTNKDKFRLTDFVENTTWPADGNCVDVSTYLCIMANSLGGSFKCARYMHNGLVGDIRTNLACPIGTDWTVDANYDNIYYYYHQVCRTWASGVLGSVYDPCIAYKLDLSGNVFKKPAYGWPFDDWWQKAPTPLGLVWFPYPSTNPRAIGPGEYIPSIQ
jgi:hypothetical protein